MKINFYASLRKITEQKTVIFPLREGITVRQMIEAVVTRYPVMRTLLLDEDGKISNHGHVFINGRDVPYLKQTMNTPLTADDSVDIFPPGHF